MERLSIKAGVPLSEAQQASLGLAPIHPIMKGLERLLEQLEWEGSPLCATTQRELDSIRAYHQQTGSLYYPMF